jgi:hypothetical protein
MKTRGEIKGKKKEEIRLTLFAGEIPESLEAALLAQKTEDPIADGVFQETKDGGLIWEAYPTRSATLIPGWALLVGPRLNAIMPITLDLWSDGLRFDTKYVTNYTSMSVEKVKITIG